MWDLRLVDPDNRTPVDFARRISTLKELERETAGQALAKARELAARWEDGKIKLFLIRKTLGYRRQHAALFANGDFLPAEVRGPAADKVVAFFRRHENDWTLTVAPRWLAREKASTGELWRGTAIVLPRGAPEAWLNVLTGTRNKVRATRAEHGLGVERGPGAERVLGVERVLDVGELLGDFPVALLSSASALAAV